MAINKILTDSNIAPPSKAYAQSRGAKSSNKVSAAAAAALQKENAVPAPHQEEAKLKRSGPAAMTNPRAAFNDDRGEQTVYGFKSIALAQSQRADEERKEVAAIEADAHSNQKPQPILSAFKPYVRGAYVPCAQVVVVLQKEVVLTQKELDELEVRAVEEDALRCERTTIKTLKLNPRRGAVDIDYPLSPSTAHQMVVCTVAKDDLRIKTETRCSLLTNAIVANELCDYLIAPKTMTPEEVQFRYSGCHQPVSFQRQFRDLRRDKLALRGRDDRPFNKARYDAEIEQNIEEMGQNAKRFLKVNEQWLKWKALPQDDNLLLISKAHYALFKARFVELNHRMSVLNPNDVRNSKLSMIPYTIGFAINALQADDSHYAEYLELLDKSDWLLHARFKENQDTMLKRMLCLENCFVFEEYIEKLLDAIGVKHEEALSYTYDSIFNHLYAAAKTQNDKNFTRLMWLLKNASPQQVPFMRHHFLARCRHADNDNSVLKSFLTYADFEMFNAFICLLKMHETTAEHENLGNTVVQELAELIIDSKGKLQIFNKLYCPDHSSAGLVWLLKFIQKADITIKSVYLALLLKNLKDKKDNFLVFLIKQNEIKLFVQMLQAFDFDQIPQIQPLLDDVIDKFGPFATDSVRIPLVVRAAEANVYVYAELVRKKIPAEAAAQRLALMDLRSFNEAEAKNLSAAIASNANGYSLHELFLAHPAFKNHADLFYEMLQHVLNNNQLFYKFSRVDNGFAWQSTPEKGHNLLFVMVQFMAAHNGQKMDEFSSRICALIFSKYLAEIHRNFCYGHIAADLYNQCNNAQLTVDKLTEALRTIQVDPSAAHPAQFLLEEIEYLVQSTLIDVKSTLTQRMMMVLDASNPELLDKLLNYSWRTGPYTVAQELVTFRERLLKERDFESCKALLFIINELQGGVLSSSDNLRLRPHQKTYTFEGGFRIAMSRGHSVLYRVDQRAQEMFTLEVINTGDRVLSVPVPTKDLTRYSIINKIYAVESHRLEPILSALLQFVEEYQEEDFDMDDVHEFLNRSLPAATFSDFHVPQRAGTCSVMPALQYVQARMVELLGKTRGEATFLKWQSDFTTRLTLELQDFFKKSNPQQIRDEFKVDFSPEQQAAVLEAMKKVKAQHEADLKLASAIAAAE